MQITIVH